jgi:serine/threonine protein kinase/tetratricopeptide (TPR) repeat protein
VDEQSIFIAALERDPHERDAFLDEACAGDFPLRRRIDRLLATHEKAIDFMDQPAGRLAPTSNQPPVARPGAQIGPYKLREEIGEGGFGVVFVAEQEKPVRRKVALKIIKPGMDTKDVIARFEAERQALALMDHPNVARVLDAGATDSGRPYFVMELVHGVPITEFCDKNKLSTRERLLLFADICRAVQHAHQKGIIHRDLKPSNIMVTLHDGKPVAKVIDFGVSKALSQQLTEKSIYTAYGQMIGTPSYMSPEQAEMSGLGIDTRSDIYSLGVLLYELLTGTTPLDAKRLCASAYAEILRIIREEEPQRPSLKISTLGEQATVIAQHRHTEPAQLRRELSGELDWIVMKCLEKDRARRYETANALARDIERHLHDEPVEACPPSVGYRLSKFARRNVRVLATSAVLGLALLVAFGAIAGSVGWAVRDQEARRTKLASQLELILDEVKQHEAKQQWPEALSATRRAEALLVGGGGDAALQRQVQDVLDDLKLVQRLEQIRLERADHEDDPKWFDKSFAAAFRGVGVDPDVMTAAEAAQRLGARIVVAPVLAVALDEWGTGRLLTLDGPGARAIWAVADLLDADPWRRNLRTLFVQTDVKKIEELQKNRLKLPNADTTQEVREMEKLAASPELLRQPPFTFFNFAMAVSQGVGRPDLGVAILRKAYVQYPGDFWINLGLAWNLSQLGPDFQDEALGYFRASLALRPQVATPWLHIGQIHQFHHKRLDEANACYQKAIALEPNSAWIQYFVGAALQGQNNWDDAATHYRKAIELDPKLGLAYANLGNILRWQNKLDESIAACRKAVEIDPNNGEFWSRLANSLSQKHPEEAIAALKKVIELTPNSAAGYMNLGNVLRAQKLRGEATSAYRRAIELDPKSAPSYYGLGMNLLEGQTDERKVDEAIALFRQGIDGDPKSVQCHWGLARAFSRMQNYDQAITSFHDCLQLQPTHADSYWGLGFVFLEQKRPAEALAAFERSVELKPNHGYANYGHGLALVELMRPDEAIAAFRRCLENEPKRADAHYQLGRLYEDQSKFDDALACFRTVLNLDAKHAEAQKRIDAILEGQGKGNDSSRREQ